MHWCICVAVLLTGRRRNKSHNTESAKCWQLYGCKWAWAWISRVRIWNSVRYLRVDFARAFKLNSGKNVYCVLCTLADTQSETRASNLLEMARVNDVFPENCFHFYVDKLLSPTNKKINEVLPIRKRRTHN